MNDGGRIAARSGLGGVMGCKKLKALCLNGSNKVKMADIKSAGELAKKYNKKIDSYYKAGIYKPLVKLAPGLGKLFRLIKMQLKSPLDALMAQIYHANGTSFTTAISAETGDMLVKNSARRWLY